MGNGFARAGGDWLESKRDKRKMSYIGERKNLDIEKSFYRGDRKRMIDIYRSMKEYGQRMWSSLYRITTQNLVY